MEYIYSLGHNKILITGLLAWATAQVVKAIIYTILHGKFSFERLFGDGGMPSCHSATVCAIATACAIYGGLDSPLFAVATILAIIVMHDAMGVRLETGRQGQFLNNIIDTMMKPLDESWQEWQDRRFKEFVGHTTSQVIIGSLLGICVSLLLNLVIWK